MNRAANPRSRGALAPRLRHGAGAPLLLGLPSHARSPLNPMRRILLLLLLALPLAASAQTVLSAGAIELSINFVAAHVGTGTNPWLVGIRQNDALVEIAGSISGSVERVILHANEQTRTTVPDDPRFAPLGAPGSSAWLLPDAPSNEVLAPGITTENRSTQPGWRGEGVPADFLAAGVPSGAFVSNRLTLTLESFAGPGIGAASNSAILLRADGETTVLARTGSAAPDLVESKLRSFGDPAVSSTGLVSFLATLVAGAGGVTAATDVALLAQYVPTGGGTALGIAWREGLTAPGPVGFRFTRLNWFFPSGDGFLLSAGATTGRISGHGVWRVSFAGGVPVFTMLIMEGQPFLSDQALKTPVTIALPTSAPHPGGTARALAADGTVTLLVRFTDGSREILQFTAALP